MNLSGQEVSIKDKLVNLLINILLLFSTCLSLTAYAGTSPQDKATQMKQVHIIYAPGNAQHDSIIKKLSASLKKKHPDITINTIIPGVNTNSVDSNSDLITSIGSAGMHYVNEHYPGVSKLLISTDPSKYKLDKKKNKNDAILFMTQSYCRQIRFIKSLNTRWKTISILNSKEKPVDSRAIQQCANRYDLNIYIVSVSPKENITAKIKHALHHSDVLLALPDSNIYNSKSVKNILLTSYRYRRPVIAFSKNFVNAGALASIYSNTDQIAQTASKLVEQYFNSDTWLKQVNHPDDFLIETNRQVFKALDLTIPDNTELKKALEQQESYNPGNIQ